MKLKMKNQFCPSNKQRNMKHKSLILITLLLLQTGTFAQEVLTLEQCKELAYQNNLKSKQAQANLEAAKETKKEAFTKYFPNVSATGSYFKMNKPLVDIEINMPGLLPAPIPVSGIEDGYVGMAMAAQPIFAGGQIVNGNKLAQIGVDVSELQRQKSIDDVSLQTEQYYYNLITLNEKTKTLNILDEQLSSIANDVQNAYNAGLCNKSDLLSIQLKQNEIKNNKIKVLNGQKVLQMLLAQLMKVSTDSFLIDTNLSKQITLPEEVFIEPQAAVNNRIEMKLLDKNVEANHLQEKMKIGSYLPTVAVGATFVHNNVMEDFTKEEQSFGRLFATVNVPISDWWGGTHAIRAQKAKRQMAEYQRQEAQEMLMIQISQVYSELMEAYDQIKINQESVAVAEENFRLNKDYFEAGTITLSDLLNAQSELQKSRDSYIESHSCYLSKLTEYKQMIGLSK